MRHFNSTIVSWVFALGAAPAYATFPTCDRYCQDPDITTTVLRQQDSVTLSTPALTTLATYRITVTHYATRDEALRPVFVDLATGVVAPDGVTPVSPAQSARIVSSSLPAALGACIALPSTAIRCTINNGLSAAGESIAFVVTVEAPQAGATPIAGNQIRLTADTTWKEPDEGPTVLEREPQRVALTPLDIPETTRAKSFVQPGGSLFTVNDQCVRSNEYIGCAATVQDPWTTTVTVTQGNTLVEIKESVDTLGCARAANLLDCRESSITIPAYAGGLTIFLRRDASTVGKHADIGSAQILYAGPVNPNPLAVYPLQVPACTDTTYGPLPKLGIPCIESRKDYFKKSVPPKFVPPGFESDWEFIIKALDNGRYIN